MNAMPNSVRADPGWVDPGRPGSAQARQWPGCLDADSWTVELPTVADTERLGAALAELLQAGDLVILSGVLGAGKTALARGIGAGLGVHGPITSPTFVIARVHRGPRVPMVHADVYRLGGPDDVSGVEGVDGVDGPGAGSSADIAAELDALDLDTDLTQAVVVVEWGEGRVERLTDKHLLVRLYRRDDDSRLADGCWVRR